MSLENFGDDNIEIDNAASNKSVPESIKGSDIWKYFTRDVNFKENKKLNVIFVVLFIHVLGEVQQICIII